MGVYNSYGEYGGQLKIGDDLRCAHYDLGDEVNVPDGVYISRSSVIVVKGGLFIAEFLEVKTKWGDVLSPRNMLESRGFILNALEGD